MSTLKFKSRQNIQIEQAKEAMTKPVFPTQQIGELPFSVDANTSMRMTIPFPKKFQNIPIITTSLLTEEGKEFELIHNIVSKSAENFIVAVQSTCETATKGTLQYTATVPN